MVPLRIRENIFDLLVKYKNWRYFLPVKANFLNIEESINMLNKPTSLIRWGDGESNILCGDSVYFQKYDPVLHFKLFRILQAYFKGRANYLLAVIPSYFDCSLDELKKCGEFNAWRRSRAIFSSMPKNAIILTALLFKGTSLSVYDSVIKMWENAEHLIIVHRDPSVVECHNIGNIHTRKTFIKIPEKDAFDEYNLIISSIRKAAKDSGFDRNNENRIIISAGPCAKALAYDLSFDGLIVHDVGKFFYSEIRHTIKN